MSPTGATSAAAQRGRIGHACHARVAGVEVTCHDQSIARRVQALGPRRERPELRVTARAAVGRQRRHEMGGYDGDGRAAEPQARPGNPRPVPGRVDRLDETLVLEREARRDDDPRRKAGLWPPEA